MKLTKPKNNILVHETQEKCRTEEHHFLTDDLRHLIQKKAYELYDGRGRVPGRDIEDWLEAERMIAAGE